MDKSGLKSNIGAGIVLTGGMTKLKHMREFAQSIFPGIAVRIGLPLPLKGLADDLKEPESATVVGLLLYKAGKHTQYEIDNKKRLLHHKEEQDSLGDIRLGSGSISHNDEAEHGVVDSTTVRDKDQIVFTDLAGFDDENKGDFLTKVKNWIKQLF